MWIERGSAPSLESLLIGGSPDKSNLIGVGSSTSRVLVVLDMPQVKSNGGINVVSGDWLNHSCAQRHQLGAK